MKALLSILFSSLILVGFLGGGYYLIKNFDKITGSVVKETVRSTTTATTTSENHVSEILPDASACETDDDCILSPITPACGCFYVINKHYNPKNIEDAVASFKSSGKTCGKPQIQCQTAPSQEHLKCISGKCDIVRPTIDPARAWPDDPEALEKQIKQHIENVNYCATDDNCTIADIDADCPFGCYNLVSKNADLSIINEGIVKYRALQPDACVYKCRTSPSAADIKCVSNKCVDARILR